MRRAKVDLGLKSALHNAPAAVNYNGMKTAISSILALLLLAGCAGELSRRDAAQTPADSQQAEPKKDAYPTFTYRPGS